jgi:hypothetical protein
MEKMKKKLIIDRNIFAAIFFLKETGWWTRCSAQIWTEVLLPVLLLLIISLADRTQVGDFEKLGSVLIEVCSEIVHELRAEEAKLKSKL